MYRCLEETDRSPREGARTSPLTYPRKVSLLRPKRWGSGGTMVLLARPSRSGVMEAGDLLSTTTRWEDECLRSDEGEGKGGEGRTGGRRTKAGVGVGDIGRLTDRLYWMGNRMLRYRMWPVRTCGADRAGDADYGSIYRLAA